MSDEPRRHRLYMVLLGLTALGTAPFPFIGSGARSLFGVPLWLWWSGLMTIGFACLTAWGITRYWKDDRFE